jgi:AcrR family transcriptional regulator
MASNPSGVGAEPGLRERKKAEMRQRISDIATVMFLERGFDGVRVADIAEQVGVSEKTIFNYFPTKESLILDQADEQVERAIGALSERESGVTPTRAFTAEMSRQFAEMVQDDDYERVREIVPRFSEMLEATPALIAAWGDHRHRLVLAIAQVLADDLGVDPRDPEPRTAARALVSLTELAYDSMLRNVEQAGSGPELVAIVEADLDRGARLLETGMGSLPLSRNRKRDWKRERKRERKRDPSRTS